jgi:hypothetical protein
MIITHNGRKFEIVNFDEFAEKLLSAIGFQVEEEVLREIDKMKLVDTGSLRTSLVTDVKKRVLEVGSTVPYAPYLEYGTLSYFDRFGSSGFPKVPDPKKKDMSPQEREKFPKGMQPFAMFRRVLWNQNKMASIINKAVRVASR